MKLRTLDLFSGIGGFSLGLQRTGGFETIAFCEIDAFCRKVLAKHWPGVPCFEDITKLDKEELDSLGRIDVICGGFPCQPVSCAGKRKGKEDARWLWPEFCRVIRCVRPEWVLIENVPGLLSADSGRLFAGILRDLSESGYDAEWNIVSAAGVGAPHLRKRVFIIAWKMANTESRRCRFRTPADIRKDGGKGDASSNSCEVLENTDCSGSRSSHRDIIYEGRETGENRRTRVSKAAKRQDGFTVCNFRATGEDVTNPERAIFRREPTGTWPIESGFCRMVDGFPGRVDRLRALGNAIVPQCATYIAECVLNYQEALDSLGAIT